MDKATADATDKCIDELETVYAGKLHQYVQKVKHSYRTGQEGYKKRLDNCKELLTKPFPDESDEEKEKTPKKKDPELAAKQPLSSQAPIRTAGSGPTTVTIQPQGTPQQQLLQVRGSISTLQQQPSRPVGTVNQAVPQLSSSSGHSTTGAAAVHSGEMNKAMLENVRQCKIFLQTAIKVTHSHPPETVKNVQALIQGLIDGKVEPEMFTERLRQELQSSPQPYLVPFLKKSLPLLRQSMLKGQMTIEGIKPPPSEILASQAQSAVIPRGQQSSVGAVGTQQVRGAFQQRPTIIPQQAQVAPVQQQMTVRPSLGPRIPVAPIRHSSAPVIRPQGQQQTQQHIVRPNTVSVAARTPSQVTITPGGNKVVVHASPQPHAQVKPKIEGQSMTDASQPGDSNMLVMIPRGKKKKDEAELPTKTTKKLSKKERKRLTDILERKDKKERGEKRPVAAGVDIPIGASGIPGQPVPKKPKKNPSKKQKPGENNASTETTVEVQTTPGVTCFTIKHTGVSPAPSSCSGDATTSAPALSSKTKELKAMKSVSAKAPEDKVTPDVNDIALLPGGLIVVADGNNKCVKLMNSQGSHIARKIFDEAPLNLAVMDVNARQKWKVAVTLDLKRYISLLEVTPQAIGDVINTIDTKAVCRAIAAVNPDTLAVGYKHIKSIEILDIKYLKDDLKDKVIGRRQLSPRIHPTSLTATSDGREVMCTWGAEIARLIVSDGHEWYCHEVGQMKKPVGITVVGDGIALVDKRSLHLLNAVDGSHQRQLWTLPKDFDKADSLASLSADSEVCVCSTKRGVVFVMDSVL